MDQMNFQGLEILTPNGFMPFHGIRKTENRKTIKLSFSSGNSIVGTPDHRLFTDGVEVFIKDVKLGDKIDPNEIVSNIEDYGNNDVFDILEVTGNVFVANGVDSHNCQFEGSSGTLISGSKLKHMVTFAETPVQVFEDLKVYKTPIKGHAYALIADVARGVGGDFSAFHVIDITSMPFLQVATYHNNTILPPDYAEVINRVGKIYNDACVLVEINDIGGQVTDLLFETYEYENIIYTQNKGRAGKIINFGGANTERGVRTTSAVKSAGCSILKMLIENDQLILSDTDTIAELSTFSKKGDSFAAESGKHDDLAMGLVLFAWLSSQDFFKQLNDTDIMKALKQKSSEDMENLFIPFGFNSNDDYDPFIEEDGLIQIF